jgi:transketolase
MKKKINSKIFQRDIFIDTLYQYAKKDKKIILISNDQGAIALDNYKKKIPDQFINAGISEQNIIGIAAGMQKEGFNCFVYSIASFIINRTIEQIKIDLCNAKIPVKIFGVGCGYSYAVDGPTHHATEDIGLLNLMPGLDIYSPSDSETVRNIVHYSIKSKNPCYVRMDRELCKPIYENKKINLLNGFTEIKKGKDYCLVATGKILSNALSAARKLSNSKNIGVIDLFKLKPLNPNLLKKLKKYKIIFTLEEHNEIGGIGSILSNLIIKKNLKIKLIKIALKENTLFGYGSRDLLQKKNNLDLESITKIIKNN